MFEPFRNEPFTNFADPGNRKAMEEALREVRGRFPLEIPVVIHGERIHTGKTFQSINPSRKDEVVATVHAADAELVNKALDAAWKAFETWGRLPALERASLLIRAAHILRRRKAEVTALMVYEVGKNWAEADADVAETIDYLEFYAREAVRYAQPQPLTPFPGEINEYFYIPLGAGAVIPPWNFPLAILTGMSVGAIAAGNTVVLKPASDSAAIGYVLVEILEEAGLPPGVLNYLPGSGSVVGEALVKHPRTRFVAFTGSRDVGIRIYEEAARVQPGQIWLKRVIAEMGGKDAIIVDDRLNDRLFEEAVKAVAASAYGYQGQKCSAASRLILLESIHDRFIDALVEEVKKISIGPADENHFMGPVINASAEAKILSYIEIGKQEGTLVHGGAKVEDLPGFYIQPTIFRDVAPDARIAQEEIFGPVLAVIRARDFDEALKIANGTQYGLTGSVYTLDREHIAKARREFHVGNLYFNRKCTGALVDVHPFGGFNMSGTDSKAGGRDYLLLFLQGKSVSEKVR